MKNFKLSVMFCVITSGASLFGDNNVPQVDCLNPSDYVMALLEESKTLYLGSDDWKESIQTKGTTAKTMLARSVTDSKEQNTLNAKFDLKNNNGSIEIDTVITDIQMDKASTIDKALDLLKLISVPASDQSDEFTRCHHTRKLFFDEETQHAEVKFSTKCTTKMPDEFFELLVRRKQFRDNLQQQREQLNS